MSRTSRRATTAIVAVSSPGLRIVCISDTHNKHASLKIPSGDVLLHTGDFTNTGSRADVEKFVSWFKSHAHKHKIFIAGNHETTFDIKSSRESADYSRRCREMVSQESTGDSITYLEDSGTELLDSDPLVDKIRVYGAPWQPASWGAFNLTRGGQELNSKWLNIPEQTDILLTHGPPLGFGDTILNGSKVGCADLLARINSMEKPPRLHVFGHIHECPGTWQSERGTLFVNAATCNTEHKPTNKPIVIYMPFDRSERCTVIS